MDMKSSYLKSSRREAGITQKQLADRAGCSLAYVQMVEGGFTPADDSQKFRSIMRVLAEATDGNVA